MRKFQKKQVDELVGQMEQAHDQIRRYIENGNLQSAMQLLGDCQDAGISIGTLIERTEGEGHPTIALLEEYCEAVYEIHENLADEKERNASKAYKLLKQKLIRVSNGVKNDIKVRLEAVFLPYKASMWDSLESVWQAADADPDCDAYVVPIPYFDKNPDGSFGRMYYEADLYPADVPVITYDMFDLEEHRPDMIFIHNPYDIANYVTSIHPLFYSDNLKKYTECLVYIPYYATAGNMSEGQALCPVYLNADYIVIQSEKFKQFFDSSIPDEKFLVFGSPKFDSVIHKCQNPGEMPGEWKEMAEGKRVYFYNTSINGMLANTDIFLKKMRYVFDTFKGREDACLLWRPHPLLESTFESMRLDYKPRYDALKKEFAEEKIGILDTNPDMEKAIALSDVYIGDAATSVTSLFGVAGKPLFIFNNYINTLPEEDDWRGEWIQPQFDIWGNNKYFITKNNQLWVSENNDYHYRFYMDLGCGYAEGGYYMTAVEIGKKIYVLPRSARHLLIIENRKIRKVMLEADIASDGAFWNFYYNDKYIFLIPFKYPYLVRLETATGQLTYMEGMGQYTVRKIGGEWMMGGMAPYGRELVFASPVDDSFLFLHMDTMQVREQKSGGSDTGTLVMVPDGEELWLLPRKGMTITCWNPKTGAMKKYGDIPADFQAISWPYGMVCDERPFGNLRISRESGRENIVISPYWGNMYLSLDRETGKMEKWELPQISEMRGKNGYYASAGMGGFATVHSSQGKAVQRIWYAPERKLYDVNLDTKKCTEVEIRMDREELAAHEAGFAEQSEWMQYSLNESAFNSLKDLLDDHITGNQFDKEKQLTAFSRINADTDGTCGQNVYRFARERGLSW